MRTIAFFLLFFVFFFGNCSQFFSGLCCKLVAARPNTEQVRPRPEARPDPESESEPSAWALVRKPNNCSQFYQDATATAATCAAQAAVSLEDLVKNRTIVRSRSPVDPGSEQRKTPEACCNWGFYRTN